MKKRPLTHCELAVFCVVPQAMILIFNATDYQFFSGYLKEKSPDATLLLYSVLRRFAYALQRLPRNPFFQGALFGYKVSDFSSLVQILAIY